MPRLLESMPLLLAAGASGQERKELSRRAEPARDGRHGCRARRVAEGRAHDVHEKGGPKVRLTICSVPRCVVIVDPAEAGHYVHEESGPDGPPCVTVSGSTRNAPV